MGWIVLGVFGSFLLFVLIIMLMVGAGESPRAQEGARFRKVRNDLALDKARREQELELKLREWQATASLEDLTRHRMRLKDELDAMHGTSNPEVFLKARDGVADELGGKTEES